MAIAWNQAGFVTTGGTDITGAVVANDIKIAGGRIVKKLTVILADDTVNDNGLFDSFSGAIGWAIYSDNGGKPGTLLFSGTDAAPLLTDSGAQSDQGGDIFRVDLALGDISLGTGTYWVAIHEGGWGAADDGTPVEWMWNPAGTGWGLVQGAPVGTPSVWVSDLHDSAFRLEGDAIWDQNDPTTAGGVDISHARGAGASFTVTDRTFLSGATVYLTDGVLNDNGQLNSFSGNLYWAINSNIGGVPGTGAWAQGKAVSIVMTDTGLQSASGADIIRVDFAFDRLTDVGAGDRFLVLHEGNDATAPFDGSAVYWSFNATGTGPDTVISSVSGGTVTWTPTGGDTSFQLWESVINLVSQYYGDLPEDSPGVSINVQQFLWASTDDYSITITRSPLRGTAVVDDNGTPLDATDDFIRYTPNAGVIGSDSFEYTVTSGTASKTGQVGVNIVPANDAPTVSNLPGDAALWLPVNSYARLDAGARAAVADIDSQNFGGGTLTVTITGGVPGEDRLYFPDTDAVQLRGNDLYVQGTRIGTFAFSGTTATITFTSSAVLKHVAEALQNLAYANTSANPTAGTRTINYMMTDGDGTALGGTDTASWTSTVNVVALDTGGIANADTRALNEGQMANIAVLANDSDANGPLQVMSINGIAISSGGSVTLPSGAVVTLLANGKLTYDPHGAFDYLVSAATGAARGAVSSALDRFVYTLPDGSTAMVSVTVNGVDGADGRLAGAAGNDVLTGTTGNDTFLLQAGGTDRATGGDGDDLFYFGSALRPGDVVDGGAGTDSLVLRGYNGSIHSSETLLLEAAMMTGIETLVLAAGSNTSFGGEAGNFYYRLKLSDAALGTGKTLTVQGSKLGSLETLNFDGSAETNGMLRLIGGAGRDYFSGGAQADWITGGGGGDSLSGGGGADTFYYRDGDSAWATGADWINDLEKIDRIDLSAIDANTNVAGNDAFTFIGAAAFSGVAGQLRVTFSEDFLFQWKLEADMNGDGQADFMIEGYADAVRSAAHMSLVLIL